METYIFYILAAIILIFSTLTVTSRKILRAAIYLLFVLIATAGLYFMVEYNFLAAVQLTVYAGGIMILVIFSILLTSQINDKLEPAGLKKSVISAAAVIAGAVLCIYTLLQYEFVADRKVIIESTVETIGEKLLSYGDYGYVLPFEVISVLLLAAMIAAIITAKRGKPETND